MASYLHSKPLRRLPKKLRQPAKVETQPEAKLDEETLKKRWERARELERAAYAAWKASWMPADVAGDGDE